MANFYLSHWDGSPFRHRLLVSRQLPDGGKLTLKNRLLARRNGAGLVESQELDDEALYAALCNDFGLRLGQSGQHGISQAELSHALQGLKPGQMAYGAMA
jgi:N-hydroxyarylamine O-acetyltransferase